MEPLLSEADVPTLKDVVKILRAIIEVRISRVQEKKTTMETSVALALSLTNVAIAKASKSEEQATLLILKGEALQVQKTQGAKEIWMKAKDVLDGLSEAGGTG
jgi:hypothetical protein